MNNITSFDKKKRELSNNSNDRQDTKKQREASSLKLSFEKASDGNAFKDSLKYEDWILILQRYIENIEKKMEELWIATKNTKESHIKGELQPVNLDETMYFISDKFDELEKDRRKKDEIVNNLSKNPSEMAKRIDKFENSVDWKERNSRRNCLSVHEIEEKNDENTNDLVLKAINEKLDVDITKNEIDRSHKSASKRMDRD